MAKYLDSRIIQVDIDVLLKTIQQDSVRIFIKEVIGTHYASVYVMLSAKEESGEEATWIYESFSDFSSDKLSRKRSMEIALEGLLRARSVLENKGIEVQRKSGMDVTNWVPCQVKKTMILYCYE